MKDRDPLWIAFAGTHCTGKTTLLNEYAKHSGAEVNSIREVARSIIKEGYPMGKDAHLDSYLQYIQRQLQCELELLKPISNLVISDRTILDTLCYGLINRQLPRPSIPEVTFEMLEQIWLLETSRYDLYVYFPIEFPLEGDGVRDEDESYRCLVDKKILEMLKKHSIQFVIVTGSVEDRVKQLDETVKSYRD